jgi:hypothetical protein
MDVWCAVGCVSAGGSDEKSCPLQGEAGSCHGDGLKNRGIYLNPWIKGGVKRRDLRMSLFFYLALISHSITIYAKIVQRVARLAYIPPGNGGFPLKTEFGPFRAFPGRRMGEGCRERSGMKTGAKGLITH